MTYMMGNVPFTDIEEGFRCQVVRMYYGGGALGVHWLPQYYIAPMEQNLVLDFKEASYADLRESDCLAELEELQRVNIVTPSFGSLEICYASHALYDAQFCDVEKFYYSPSEPDVLYVEFGGIWKLERDYTDYTLSENRSAENIYIIENPREVFGREVEHGTELDATESEQWQNYLYGEWQLEEGVTTPVFSVQAEAPEGYSNQFILSASSNLYLNNVAKVPHDGTGRPANCVTIAIDVVAGTRVKSNYYLEEMYGICSNVRSLQWNFYKVETDTIQINSLYAEGLTEEVPFPEGVEELIMAVPDFRMDRSCNTRIYSSPYGLIEGERIYIDPNDPDVIYLDCCGLWKLIRQEREWN